MLAGMLALSLACNAVATPTAPDPALSPTPSPAAPTAPDPASSPTPSPAAPTASPTVQLPLDREPCPGAGRAGALLVDAALESRIRAGLDQFAADLCGSGYSVVERVAEWASPPDVRTYLADTYGETDQRLAGAILIGDLPYVYQYFTTESLNPSFPDTWHEALTFQYYADLDGVFEASPGHTSPFGHPYSFDVHSGAVDCEIWIGVLPLYKGDPAATAEAINRYFDKNHAYRAGEYDLPRAFLEVDEFSVATTAGEHEQMLEWHRSGVYAWTPFSDSADASIYFESSTAGLSVDQGYQALSDGVADFAALASHGTWAASGRIDIEWVESRAVRTVFLVSGACSVGEIDRPDTFLASVLYSPTSTVLVAHGTTSESGGMGTNENGFYGHNIATALSAGESYGDAFLGHVNVPLLWPWSEDRELHFALQVILGDPTLTLRQ